MLPVVLPVQFLWLLSIRSTYLIIIKWLGVFVSFSKHLFRHVGAWQNFIIFVDLKPTLSTVLSNGLSK